MSKTSNRARYAQLMEWLNTRVKPRKKPVESNGQSRLNYYNKKNA